jgi:myo-inositol-1(or 4)-monophosphatase
MDLAAVREIASQIALQAGAALMQKYGQPHDEKTKSSIVDIVTEGDAASEAVVIPGLTQHFPNHHIISEEGGGHVSAPAESAEYFWYIDPLDGTSNYAHNIPFFSVSIGLADRQMRPLVGVVYDPFSDELYSAARGLGATLNGKALRVSATDTLQKAMLCSGFPYDYPRLEQNNLREWDAFHRVVRGLRRFGSVALELSYIAAGRLDGLWEQRLHTWDIMAGLIIVEEAGGRVSDNVGEQSAALYEGQQLVASNGHLHTEMLALLQSVRS